MNKSISPVTVSSGRVGGKRITKSLKEWVVILDSYEHHKIDEEMEQLTTLALIEKLDEALEIGDDSMNWDLYTRVFPVLAQRFNYATIEGLTAEFKEHINRLTDAIIELNKKFENHRHPKDRTYTDKPVW